MRQKCHNHSSLLKILYLSWLFIVGIDLFVYNMNTKTGEHIKPYEEIFLYESTYQQDGIMHMYICKYRIFDDYV